MALVQKVQGIIAAAAAIGEMNMFQRPAAYEQLVKDEIVPVLLAVAQHIDGAAAGQSDEAAAQIAELKQEITTLKGRVTKLQKSSTGAVA